MISEFIKGAVSLLKGMAITLKTMFLKPVTIQYPDERREMPLRFRGRLVLPVDAEKGGHRCTACQACVRACPNRTLEVTRMTDETGKPRPRAAAFRYNLGSCMFCNLCVETCPFFAIVMSDEYELATDDRSSLIRDLAAEEYLLPEGKGAWWKRKFRDPSEPEKK